MKSDADDYIGQGLERTLTEPAYTFSASMNYDNGATISVNGTETSSFWSLNFAAPGEVLLENGAYENATRFPFQSPTGPGLSVTGEGRGCNTLTGRFTVHEVVYGANNTIDVFAADFEQHCSGATPALVGAIRFNSELPIFVTDPVASAGADQQVTEGDVVVLDGSNSTPGAGAELASYHWSQVGGTAVTLNNPGSAVASFTAPSVSLDGDTLAFELSVTDSSGVTATDLIDIHVVSQDAPKTFVKMFSDSGDYIGQGQSYDFNANNGVFTLSQSTADKAVLTYHGSHYWSFGFAAIQGTGLSVGSYQNATRLLGVATNNNPVLRIDSPVNGSTHYEGSPVTFSATALDPEDGDITASIAWSTPGYTLPEGPTVTLPSLTAGSHTFTATVTDSAGATALQEIDVVSITNTPPTVSIIAPVNGAEVSESDTISLTAFASDNEDGDISDSIVWSSSIDGDLGTGGQAEVSYLKPGTHLITAVATDSNDASVMTNVSITVQASANTEPRVSIQSPLDNTSISYGQTLTLKGNSSDGEEGDLSGWITWESNLSGYLGTGSSVSGVLLPGGDHVITATVTDSGGLSASATVSVSVTTGSSGFCAAKGKNVYFD